MAETPIVLIHGLIGHLKDCRTTQTFKNANLHTPDLVGYGTLRSEPTTDLTLDDQATRVISYMSTTGLKHAHLVGHSVGGAVAVLVADRDPKLAASVTSVEGNFTIEDAFWSAQIAQTTAADVADLIAKFRSNPGAWIAQAGVPVNGSTARMAASWLDNQPPETIRAQAAAVVAATQSPAFLEAVHRILQRGTPLNLIAGERSAPEWGVPQWVRQQSTSDLVIPAAGHLMMAEDPEGFANAVLAATR